jgi:cytochrome c oxidase subunit 2
MPGPVRRAAAISLLAFAAALALAGAALAGAGGAGVTPQASTSPNAHGIHRSYMLIGFVTLAIFILVEGTLITFLVRYRRRNRPRLEDGQQIHGSTRLELIWTVAPAVILAGIAAFVLATLPGIKDVPSASANGGRLDVTVEGHQFYWLFKYPNGAIGFDDMVVPAGKNVKLTVVAPAVDVIHSWWVPKLGGKIDAIPGRTNHTWFTAPAPGVFVGQCAELCGVQHAQMTNSVRSVGANTYAAYVQKQKQLLDSGSAELGKQEWDHVCAKCHNMDPTGPKLIGPNLGGNSLLQQPDALSEIVHNGRGLMPPVGAGWSDKQVDALVAYAKSLQSGGGAG